MMSEFQFQFLTSILLAELRLREWKILIVSNQLYATQLTELTRTC